MIAVRTGNMDFVLLPLHEIRQARLRETGLVVMCHGIMYLLYDIEGAQLLNINKNIKHSIPKHILTLLDCYI